MQGSSLVIFQKLTTNDRKLHHSLTADDQQISCSVYLPQTTADTLAYMTVSLLQHQTTFSRICPFLLKTP